MILSLLLPGRGGIGLDVTGAWRGRYRLGAGRLPLYDTWSSSRADTSDILGNKLMIPTYSVSDSQNNCPLYFNTHFLRF